jgi:hypothetical protein
MMNDVMLDIETLDVSASSVILSIGAVRFDIDQIDSFGPAFSAHLSIADQIRLDKRTISEDTLFWWLGQSDEARNALLSQTREDPSIVLRELAQFISPTDFVWGNGSDFDNAILADAYRSKNYPLPWRYRNNRCYRTMKAAFPYVPKPAFVGIPHNAVDDARNQALHLQHIRAHIKNEQQA